MKKFTLHKNFTSFFVFLFLACLCKTGISQTLLYATDFGTVANTNPPGWTFTGIDMNISTNNASTGYAGASGNAYLGEGNSVTFTNTLGNQQTSSQIGTSEAILLVNTVGFSTVTLGFGMRKSSAGYNSNATYTLEWSTNGSSYAGIVYTEATAGSWGLASGAGLTLPPGAANQPSLYIKWTFVRTGTASNFKIDDVSITGISQSSNSPPTITMDIANTNNYLDGGATSPPGSPFNVSGVINDPTDPAKNFGIDFLISDAQTAATNLTVTCVSSNTSVVLPGNITITGSGGSRNIKITPNAVGYANITLNVDDGTSITPYIINYASSAASSIPSSTFWHTGMSDASDAIAIDNNYYMSGDDELNVLNVYSRSASGLPVMSFNYTSFLALPDPTKPEVDVEAATSSNFNPNKVYWLGSMSNGSNFTNKPNRDRLFATTFTGTGASTSFSFAGYYGNLRSQLSAWGDSHGYNFTASAASGVDSKTPAGFAAEGMVFGPDSTTLYIGMRAPLVPVSTRTNAVIAPITNFEAWFNNGSPSGNPSFGSPIELNLGGRGIRDLIRLPNGTYIIVAGNPGSTPNTSAIYKWTGNAADVPIRVMTSGDGLLNMEGAMPVMVSSQLSLTKLQVISDGGGDILYADGTEAKDLGALSLRKFRSDNLYNIDLCLIPSASTPTITQQGSLLMATPGLMSYQWFVNNAPIPSATTSTYNATGDGDYYVVGIFSNGCTANSSSLSVSVSGIAANTTLNYGIMAYPNPFTESTNIRLDLKEDAAVTIEIYDLIGQKVEGIANMALSQGTHTFNFDARKAGYSSGVYFVKTTVNDKVGMLRIVQGN